MSDGLARLVGPVGVRPAPMPDWTGLDEVDGWVRRAEVVTEGVEMGRYENLEAVGLTVRMLASKEVAGVGITYNQHTHAILRKSNGYHNNVVVLDCRALSSHINIRLV